MESEPRTMPLLARTGLGTPIWTQALGRIVETSALASDSKEWPSMKRVRMALEQSMDHLDTW